MSNFTRTRQTPLTKMTYKRASSETSDVRMIARRYRRGKRIFVRTDSAPRGGTGVRKGCRRKSRKMNIIRLAVTVPVSLYRGPDKNIRWINLWWKSTNSEGAELFHEVSDVKKRRWIHVMARARRVATSHTRLLVRVDMYMLRTYAKYTWDRYHSLHIYGKVVPFFIKSW